MAEVTAMRNNALPYPVYGVAYTIVYPMLDADGDLVTGATTPDAEVSKNGDTFADCTNESTEIATNSGVYYLTLTATEMTADIVTVIAKSATAGMKTTVIVLYPRKLAILSTGTCQGSNDTGDIQLASGDSAVDDIYNGCLCVAVIDGTTEARIINDYVGSTKVGEVSPAWNTAQPDSSDTYTIYMPEGRGALLHAVNAIQWNSLATVKLPLAPTTAGRDLDVSAGGEAGLDWANIGSPTTTVNLSGTSTKAVEPTVAGRTLDVSAGGEAGVDWANVGSQSTSVNLSATTINLVNTATTVTNQLTAAAIATGVWQDATASDFTTASSIGKSLYTSGVVPGGSGGLLISGSNSGTTTLGALTVSGATTLTGAVTASNASNNIVGVSLAANQHVIVDSGTVTTVTNQLTAAQIATGVWTDTTAGDFTVALSVGKSVMNGVSLGTGLTVARCTLVDTLTTYTSNTPQTGDNYARLGAPVGASISADIAAVQADLPNKITKNVALANFEFFMTDSADHISGKTGLTITATRSIDGAAFGSCANSASEVGSGVYKIDLAAADLNGNVVTFKFAATGADTRVLTVVTQPT